MTDNEELRNDAAENDAQGTEAEAQQAVVDRVLSWQEGAPVETVREELRKAAAHPMTQKPAVGFKAEGEIKRSDFNLGMLAPAVSDEMEITISAEAIKG